MSPSGKLDPAPRDELFSNEERNANAVPDLAVDRDELSHAPSHLVVRGVALRPARISSAPPRPR